MLNTYVNKEKRTIVVIITEGSQSFIGKAKCSPNDSFDESKGKKIALKRAQIKFYKKQNESNISIWDFYMRMSEKMSKKIDKTKRKILKLTQELQVETGI